MAQLVSKIISNNYLFLLKFMLILNAFWKELGVVIKIMVHTQKNIKITFLANLLTKLVVCVDNKFSKKLFFTEEKILFIDSLKQFLKSMVIVKK